MAGEELTIDDLLATPLLAGKGFCVAGVYIRFSSGTRISLHARDGRMATMNLGGKMHADVDLEEHCMLKLLEFIARGDLPKPERLAVLAREVGQDTIHDGKPCLLKAVTAMPGKKVAIGKTRQLVPMCNECGALLFSKYAVNGGVHLADGMAGKDDEFTRSTCPYCNKKLKCGWRVGLVHEVDFPLDSDSVKHDMRFYTLGYNTLQFPVEYMGNKRPLQFERADLGNLLAAYMVQCTGGQIGPLLLQFSWTGFSVSELIITGDLARENRRADTGALGYPKIAPAITVVPRDMLISRGVIVGKATTQSMLSRIDVTAVTIAQQQGMAIIDKKVLKSKKRGEMLANLKDQVHELPSVLQDGVPFDSRGFLSNVYLRMAGTRRNINFAKYYATLCDPTGKAVSLPVKLATKPQPLQLDEITIRQAGLRLLMNTIQHNDAKIFSEVKFYVLESMIQYQAGPPHYYLEPILNEPGKQTRLPKSTYTVKACKHCDVALLRFSFDWVMQRDDLAGHSCPYCGKPLEVVERERRVVPVTLNFEAKDCQITGTNNQIGVLYNGHPIKLTVKVKSMLHFLQNYEAQFPRKVMGPFKTRMASQLGALTITSIEFEVATPLSWRPVVLYPEDLIAM